MLLLLLSMLLLGSPRWAGQEEQTLRNVSKPAGVRRAIAQRAGRQI